MVQLPEFSIDKLAADLMKKNGSGALEFRVYVSTGCHEYSIQVDENRWGKKKGDTQMSYDNGVTISIDVKSYEILRGLELTTRAVHERSLMTTGQFELRDPYNVLDKCGCGLSFSRKKS